MNLLTELENDLAVAFLVEKKHQEKLNPKQAFALIAQIRESLLLVLSDEESRMQEFVPEKISAQQNMH